MIAGTFSTIWHNFRNQQNIKEAVGMLSPNLDNFAKSHPV
jgi:hypothetical protein